MCGICGSSSDFRRTRAARMNAAMASCGPDDVRVFTDYFAGVSLGSRRLTVIDPSARASARIERGRDRLGRAGRLAWTSTKRRRHGERRDDRSPQGRVASYDAVERAGRDLVRERVPPLRDVRHEPRPVEPIAG
jgi:hypothetical protein